MGCNQLAPEDITSPKTSLPRYEATKPFNASQTKVSMPGRKPAVRITFVAPALPLPRLRTSFFKKAFANITAKFTLPIKYAAITTAIAANTIIFRPFHELQNALEYPQAQRLSVSDFPNSADTKNGKAPPYYKSKQMLAALWMPGSYNKF